MTQRIYRTKRCSRRYNGPDLEHERTCLVLFGRRNRDTSRFCGCSARCGNAFRGGRADWFTGLRLWTFRGSRLRWS